MIIKDASEIKGYTQFLNQYLKFQRKGNLEKKLPRLLTSFVKKNHLEWTLFQGFSEDQIQAIELSSPYTIDVLFKENGYSPWLRFHFLNDYTELMVRGGPALHEYMYEDDHCDKRLWSHTFYLQRDINAALTELAEENPFILMETEAQPHDKILTDDEYEVILRPVRFPRSLLKVVFYIPLDYEVREEVLPVLYLQDIMLCLRSHEMNRKND
jgi:hypothetical protein